MVEEHLKQAGAAGARSPTSARARRSVPSACAAARRSSPSPAPSWPSTASGSCTARPTTACARRPLGLLEAFHAENPLRAGISREELRSRAGHAQERVFAQLLARLEAEGLVQSERDQVRLASHAIRLTPDQQRVVDGLEADFRQAGATPPSPEEALGRLGVKGTSGTSCSSSWWPTAACCG